jgi:DNA-binding transcriptional regulator YiaG
MHRRAQKFMQPRRRSVKRTRKDDTLDVKALRLRLALTQEELARQLGVSLSTVSRWETGRSSPSRLARQRLSELSARRDA